MLAKEISMYNQGNRWLILGLLLMSLFSIALLDAYTQEPNSTGEKDSGNFIRRWLALGPFVEGELAIKAIEVDYLKQATGIPESQFATLSGVPKAGDSVFLTLEGYATQERIWKVLEMPESWDVNRMLLKEGYVDFAVAYLLTFIESKEATRRELMIGSDDAVKVWLNGELVHTAALDRSLRVNEDRFAVNLKDGVNVLMMKVANTGGYWALSVRFADDEGLKFLITPDGSVLPVGKRLNLLPIYQTQVSESRGTEKYGRLKTYRYVDGLADNGVRAIAQDREGVLWFGTGNGLSRFDGTTWTTFTTQNGLAYNSIRPLILDREGVLWIGTMRGLNRYDGQSWFTITRRDGLASDDVTAILQAQDGTLWVGTLGGVSHFDGINWNTFTQQDGLPGNDVSAILQDQEGRMWIGTGIRALYDGVSSPSGGVSCYDGQTWTTYTQQDGLPGRWISKITQDKDGVLWVEDYEGGVSRYDGKNWTTVPVSEVSTLIDVIRYDGQRWATHTQQDNLVSNEMLTVFEDREGILWFGKDGVNKLDATSWTIYTQQNGLARNGVNVIFQDKKGVLWVGMGDKLNCFNGKTWTIYTKMDRLEANAITQTRDGALWVGGIGVSRFDGIKWTTYRRQHGLASKRVHAIAEDQEGTLWLGGSPWLSRFDGTTWTTYTREDGLSSDYINAIAIDKKGCLWVGTSNGVSQYDGTNWTTYTPKEGLAGYGVKDIHQDHEGIMWFGTRHGVSRFDGREWINYTTKDGLTHNDVRGIAEDQEGTLWFGTWGGGVSLFDRICFQSLDSRDGLLNDYITSVCAAQDGTIWFGTGEGLVQFTPNKVPPLIRITRMVADNSYDKPKGKIELPADVSRLTFMFRGSSFKTRPGAMLYLYQLVGHDKDWQKPTHNETAEYIGLSPGHYTFQVKAVDRDLNYSDPPASVEVIIPPPPFYKRTTFVAAVSGMGGVLLIIVIVLAVNQWRLSQAERKRLRQELDDAREMQTGLLPETAPSVPGFEIHGFSQPAREVGGDFYDYLTLDTELIGIALADVSDKGLRAAMNAVMTNGMLHEAAKSEQAAANLLSVLNAGLCSRLQRLTNVAFALFILDPQAKTLTYANAGQPLPIVKRKDDAWEAELIGGFPLGSIADFEYEEKTITLQPGDYVILYTDGISEAMNEAEEMYVEERLIESIRQADMNLSAEEIIKHILQDVMAFVGDAEQYDDMTLVVVRCLEEPSPAET